MKRLFTFLLTVSIMFTLVACSGSNVDPYSVTLAAADYYEPESSVTLPSEITFDRLTVCESDDYEIKIRGITPDAPDGYTLSVSFSNNTEITEVKKTEIVYQTDDDGEKEIVGEKEVVEQVGTTYLFVVESAVVNGTEIDIDFNAKVAADESAFDQIILDKAALNGLGTITEIELLFKVYVTREEDYLISEISTTVYPYGDLESME